MPNSKVGSLETLVPEQPADDAEEDSGQLLPSFPAESRSSSLRTIVEGYEDDRAARRAVLPARAEAEAYTFDPDAGIKLLRQLPKVTEEILRNILLQYASENCCQSSQFIRDLPIIKIETTLAWHYCLETYLEARYTCWTFEPFDNQKVDGRENGRPPAPWEVELKPDRPFKDEDKETVVPHTCRLKPCHHCSQAGCLACQRCKGRRYLRCGECSGQGKRTVLAGHRGQEGGLLWLRWPGEK
uniref:Protein SSUH2 homolog n=1 Tax=Macrostomum lignano TaxID=282301 RepID=A0A1I8FFT2_9PLAT